MPLDFTPLLSSAGFTEKAGREVPRVTNRLLGQTFLHQDVEADKDDYYFVHRYREAFESMLKLSGFNLLH